MNTAEKINVFVDHNESARKGRADALKIAVEADPRFAWGGAAELPLDVQFSVRHELKTKHDSLNLTTGKIDTEYTTYEGFQIWNVELKEGADLLASLKGHLYEQMLSARELETPCALCILATDEEVEFKCECLERDSMRGTSAMTYKNMLRDFEAQCFALNVPVFYFSRRWPERLLSHAAALFSGGNLAGHRPKVIEGERQIMALCALADRLGPVTARNILAHFGTFGKAIAAFSDPFCNANFENIDLLGPVKTERVYKSVNKKLEFRP